MQIVELGDCSMVIMKDSNDAPWFSVGKIYREAAEYNNRVILVEKWSDDNPDIQNDISQKASECIYTAGRLILFFKDQVNPGFHLHDRVDLRIQSTRRSRRH